MNPAMDAKEFSRRLSALAQDIIDAHVHYKLWRELQKQQKDNPAIMAQSPAFWRLTMRAHLNSCLYHLSRVYVAERFCMSISMLLAAIKEDEKQFGRKGGVAGAGPLVECLVKGSKPLDGALLNEDMKLCAVSDVLVRKLIATRAKGFSKIGTKVGVSPKRDEEALLLGFRDIDMLLARALTVFRHYSSQFEVTSQSGKVIANDDYKNLFRSVADAMGVGIA